MNLFAGFANPFAMPARPSASASSDHSAGWSSSIASASTSSSLSPAPSSASSQSSFASCDSQLQPAATFPSPRQAPAPDHDLIDHDEDLTPIRFPTSAASGGVAHRPAPPDSPFGTSREAYDALSDELGGAPHHPDEDAPMPHPPSVEQLPPLPPPPPQKNSFAEAQAAMAANNSSHSQNLIGHVLDASTATHISHLEFCSVLGLGAYGVVYLARDIAAQPTPWPTSRAHPQLGNLPLYAVKCLNKFCEDGDLFGMITDRQRYLGDDEMIRHVFLQILNAVDFCHQNRIYHRDLKPENILCLDDGERVVLADFGLATHERTSGDFGCGSTFYMSPECQGGLFQRLSTYSTPHNDVWSLGVILVNLTCGRNPWKQACPSDETFCAYLGNPDFLRSILPISDHTNRILKRIFALNPQARISLAELRREILAVKRFTMTEEELQHATRATREAAKAFAQSGKEHASPERPAAVAAEHGHESNVVYVTDSEEEGDGDDAMQDVEVVAKPAPTWTYADESQFATPTQPYRKTPLTPPATPRRSTRSAHSPADPVRRASPTPRRRRVEEPLTPPTSSWATFKPSQPETTEPPREQVKPEAAVQVPPTPVTPTQRRRTSPTPPTRRSPRTANRLAQGSSRRRRPSADSSSSDSGSFEEPPTPTAARYSEHASKVRISGEDSPTTVHRSRSAEVHLQTNASRNADVPAKTAYTAYYPIWSDDWADACRTQQADYHVELPPPVVLPAEMDDDEYEFPVPPHQVETGYYTRVPATR
ncbi:hypothetical protein JCM8202_006198 [Rhodotorula sphaerocarpa]